MMLSGTFFPEGYSTQKEGAVMVVSEQWVEQRH